MQNVNLKGLDRRDAAVWLALVVVSGERPFQHCSCVLQINRLLNRDVAPVRHLDDPGHAGDGQEWAVVFIVHLQSVLTREKLNY